MYPLVTEITSFIDLSKFEITDGSTSLFIRKNLNEDSVGRDGIDDFDVTYTVEANNVLFTISNENNAPVRYTIGDNLSVVTYNENLQRVFSSNPAAMKTYGLRGAKCMAWVKNVMADLGILSVPFGNVDAWDFFAGLPNNRIKFFNPSLSSSASKAYNYGAEINDDLAIVMGYFTTSSYARTAANAILAKNDAYKISKLKEFKNFASTTIPPITHIGFSYKGIFYDFTNSNVRVGAKSSFIPIAYVEIDSLLKSKIPLQSAVV
jgi:hypothetical protein